MAGQQAVDYQNKYEVFLREVLKDIELKTQAAQHRAEENVAASEEYCAALKKELQESLEREAQLREREAQLREREAQLREREAELRERLESSEAELQKKKNASSDVAEFLSIMTGVSVSVVPRNSHEIVYHCRLEDGKLKGHEFTLLLNRKTWEYTYNPIKISPELSTENSLAQGCCFPDYMIGRFLSNVLITTYDTA